jgi:hypothetical protein
MLRLIGGEPLVRGEIDPDLLAAADPAACQAHIE